MENTIREQMRGVADSILYEASVLTANFNRSGAELNIPDLQIKTAYITGLCAELTALMMFAKPHGPVEPEPEWIESPASSNIAGFGYNTKERMLTIEFKSGGIYDYFDVPATIYEEMKADSSKGGYFHANIYKQFRYDKRKV